MANSIALDIVNFALEASGFDPILTLGAYTDPTQLSKQQRQSTLLLDLAQHKMGVYFNKRFMQRQFTLTTTAGNPDGSPGATQYTIPSTLVEGFKANSFFNVTSSGYYNKQLDVMTYEMWQRLFPRPDLEPLGAPLWIVPLPEDGTNTAKVIVWPYSDVAYSIRGIARIVVSKIQAGSDPIIFPPHYEYVIIAKLMALLEQKTNEGREAFMEMLASECADEVMRDATGAYEEVEPMDLGIQLYSVEPRQGDFIRDPIDA